MYLRIGLRSRCNIGILRGFIMLLTFKSSNEIYKTEKTIFEKKSVIKSRISEIEAGGIIRSGCVFLEYTDPDGIRRILDMYNPGDIYLRKLLPSRESDSFILSAQTKVTADLFYSYNESKEADNDAKGISANTPLDKDAKGISTNTPLVIDAEAIYEKSQKRLLSHLCISCQHTLKKKLMCFFDYLSQGKRAFTLPMSLTDCADFIGADRSSMMREIGKMESNGIIRHKGRHIELLN